jgi:superfamily I DNA/RNA helicase
MARKYIIKRDASSLPDKLTRYREELNAEQFRVVTAKPQATLIIAGAGTGKTRTITYRVAYLIEQGVSPQRIFLATFTNRAAREMLKRVEMLTGSQNVHKIWGGTFHRIANLILRRHALSIGFDSNYSILDAEDARDFLSVCVDEAAIDTKAKRFPKPEVVQNIISYANNTDTPLEDIIIQKYPYFEPLTQQIKRVDMIYMERKRERNVMDYDDLLLNWKKLLIQKPDIAAVYAEQFEHILVDEYQDTNKLQAEIIDLLTFHRIANLILRRHALSIGFDSNYSILDAEDARDFLSVCVDEAAIDTKAKRFPKPEVVQNIISYANNTDTPLEDIIIQKYPYFEPLTQQIKRVDMIYMERKRERNVMDYDDLLLNWKKLLIQKPDIAAVYAEQFEHILVDEYQDTNKLQAEIIDLLAVKHRNVTVVGDDAQSIFAWRGAEFTNIYEFPNRYPEAEIFKLEMNYRSTPEILAVANTSIASNRKQFPKVLQAIKKSKGFLPALVPCSDVEQQSTFIASRILELRDEGTSLEEIAVLYRSHYHSIELQLELTRRNIPYRIQSGVRFFEQAHIKDVISYLRIIVNPRDELAWKRLLKMIPSVGSATANKIFESLAYAENPLALAKTDDFKYKPRSTQGWTAFVNLLETLTFDANRNNPAKQIEIILSGGYEQHLQETYENAEARMEDLKGLATYA